MGKEYYPFFFIMQDTQSQAKEFFLCNNFFSDKLKKLQGEIEREKMAKYNLEPPLTSLWNSESVPS